jgi:heat shock protein HtpX
MGKRILLFILTNIAIVFTISIILSVLGVDRYVSRSGLDMGSLLTFCFIWGMGGAFISLQMSRWIAKRSTGMTLVDGHTGNAAADRVYAMIANLTQQAGLPMPEVGIYDSPEVNAFATGPSKDRALVAVSTGILQAMKDDELQGVLGHEITHISNGDMVTMTLLQGVINAFVMFFARLIAFAIANSGNDRRERGYYGGGSYMIVWILQIVLGIFGSIITAWFSRQREFRADHGGAMLAGRDRMIAALRRLQANREMVDTSQAQLATLKIHDLPGWTSLFSTHPSLEVRIAALEHMT